jgi:HSP20 family protein
VKLTRARRGLENRSVNKPVAGDNNMADVNVERRQERGLESRFQGGLRRGETGLFRSDPSDLFSMSPFTLMRRLTDDMDRMFSGFGGAGGFGGTEMRNWAPPVEVRENQGNLVIAAELPGLNKEDVKVEVTDEAVVIQGERKREKDEERGGIHRSERYYGSFYREIPLPQGANSEQAKAQFNNGLLEVTVPIAESQRKTRQVPIEAGEERKSIGSQGKTQTQTSKAG